MPIKVLIADDHEVARRGLASLLKDSPARVVGEAETPAEAIRMTRRLKPDVVLLDVRFGDEDGLDAIKKIRAAAQGVRVVMFSAYENPTYVARSVSAGDARLPLTPRETQVLRHVAMGLSNKEIADSLEISVETVKEHVQNLLRKVSLADRTQAAVWAIRQGLA